MGGRWIKGLRCADGIWHYFHARSSPAPMPYHITSRPTQKGYWQKYQGWWKYLAVVRELRKKKAEQLGTVRLETWVG